MNTSTRESLHREINEIRASLQELQKTLAGIYNRLDTMKGEVSSLKEKESK